MHKGYVEHWYPYCELKIDKSKNPLNSLLEKYNHNLFKKVDDMQLNYDLYYYITYNNNIF